MPPQACRPSYAGPGGYPVPVGGGQYPGHIAGLGMNPPPTYVPPYGMLPPYPPFHPPHFAPFAGASNAHFQQWGYGHYPTGPFLNFIPHPGPLQPDNAERAAPVPVHEAQGHAPIVPGVGGDPHAGAMEPKLDHSGPVNAGLRPVLMQHQGPHADQLMIGFNWTMVGHDRSFWRGHRVGVVASRRCVGVMGVRRGIGVVVSLHRIGVVGTWHNVGVVGAQHCVVVRVANMPGETRERVTPVNSVPVPDPYPDPWAIPGQDWTSKHYTQLLQTFTARTNMSWLKFKKWAYEQFETGRKDLHLGYRISSGKCTWVSLTSEPEWKVAITSLEEKALVVCTRPVAMELMNICTLVHPLKACAKGKGKKNNPTKMTYPNPEATPEVKHKHNHLLELQGHLLCSVHSMSGL
ncbi:hypothetical protein EDB85DRAFT_1887634 [Lactarius pseudohatsudake]|nr:hypothetical protein EDB85DRAFT_1887634 [Lactarius pseudohatsudake]